MGTQSESNGGKPPRYEELIARPDFDWLSLLEHAGATEYLSGKHMPCPFCGGKDRFRFSRERTQWWCETCNGRHWGSPSDFCMRFMGFTAFMQLADYIRGYFGFNGRVAPAEIRPARAPAARAPTIDVEERLRRLHRILEATGPVKANDPVDRYLRGRLGGLQRIPGDIRVHPGLQYWERGDTPEAKPRLLGTFPAMIVPAFDADGNLVQVHKTYLTREGVKAAVPNPKKTDLGVGCNSFALRLGWPEGDTLGVAEGIETALAATILDGHVVWSCHSSTILANFILPVALRGQIKRLVIYADSDLIKGGRRAGSEAAAHLAQRCKEQRLRTLIVRPAKTGHDMADLVCA